MTRATKRRFEGKLSRPFLLLARVQTYLVGSHCLSPDNIGKKHTVRNLTQFYEQAKATREVEIGSVSAQLSDPFSKIMQPLIFFIDIQNTSSPL